MTVFQQRATTAIVFSAVMLTGLFWNQWSFHLLFLIIATGCIWEFLDMTLPNDKNKNVRKIIGASMGLMVFVSHFCYHKDGHAKVTSSVYKKPTALC